MRDNRVFVRLAFIVAGDQHGIVVALTGVCLFNICFRGNQQQKKFKVFVLRCLANLRQKFAVIVQSFFV